MPETTAVLLVHDGGELDEIAGLLRGLGVSFAEARGSEARRPIQLPRDLLVASVPRALSMPPPAGTEPRGPARLAVGCSDGHDVRDRLRAAGFDLLVRTPVHPTALRLLLLRLLYRGPERRAHRRAAVGVETRYRRWLRWRPALLAEISSGGCRILAPGSVAPGRHLVVELPDPESSRRAFRVKGRVVRSNAVGPTDPTAMLAIAFPGLGSDLRDQLEALVDAHASGPAPLAGPPALLEPAPEADATESEARDVGDRRRAPRTRYRSRVVTLGEEAAHVVIGRDLSSGGLRIEPHGALECGQRVSVALHGASLSVPLVVRGAVARDDGEAGLLIRFAALLPAQQIALERLLAEQSTLDSLARDGNGACFVTEILAAGEKPAA